jgi:Zn-finger nucleic acid-binding protein
LQPVHTLHCENCGGNLEKGTEYCPFCNALVDLSSARLTEYCPSCLSMSKEGAKFCSSCGKPLTVEPDRPEKVDEKCPRCNVSMRKRQVESHRVVECPVCLGMFVSVDAFESIIRKQEARGLNVAGHGTVQKAASTLEPVTYIKCPECHGVMNRVNYSRISGVIVDCCKQHGFWLDNGELEKIAAFVASGGLKERYRLEKEEAAASSRNAARKTSADLSLGTGGALFQTEASPSASGLRGLFDLIAGLFD